MNLLDRAVSYMNPQKGLERIKARQTLDFFNSGYPNKFDEISKWIAQPDSPDNDMIDDLDDLRGKARNLYMNNEIAGAVLTKIKTNVVGQGLMPKPSINYKYLGITKEKAKEYEKIIKLKFSSWATSDNSDSTRMNDFYTLQSLVILSWIMSGDVFIIPQRKKRQGVEMELCIQILEADRILNPSGANENTKGGVEFDENGEVFKFYISNKHPGDGQGDIKGYPVYNSLGRRNILHVFEPERPGQRRGIPLLAPLLSSLKQLGRYQNAEITSAVMNAMIGLIIEKPDSANPGYYNTSYGTQNNVTQQSEPKYDIKNATVIETYKGHTVKEFQTTRPNKNYKDFVETVIEGMGARVTLPKEVLMSSFKSSYSAARAALEEAHKRFLVARKLLEIKFCQPIYEEFVLELIKNGEIDCPNFFEDPGVRYAFTKAIWIGPNKASLDPLKDAKAAQVNLANKTTTREMTGYSLGYDMDDIVDEIEDEELLMASIEKKVIDVKKGGNNAD